jgi:hypothetical protein
MFGEFAGGTFVSEYDREIQIPRKGEIISVCLKTAQCVSGFIIWKVIEHFTRAE